MSVSEVCAGVRVALLSSSGSAADAGAAEF